jgi:hypothetical protein
LSAFETVARARPVLVVSVFVQIPAHHLVSYIGEGEAAGTDAPMFFESLMCSRTSFSSLSMLPILLATNVISIASLSSSSEGSERTP